MMSAHSRARAYVGVALALGLAGAVWFAQRGRQKGTLAGSTEQRPDLAPDDAPPERPDQIGLQALLGEMVDLVRLTRSPVPPYVAHLASSYDRRSLSPGDPLGWFANDAWVSRTNPNYVRVEEISGRREYVLL